MQFLGDKAVCVGREVGVCVGRGVGGGEPGRGEDLALDGGHLHHEGLGDEHGKAPPGWLGEDLETGAGAEEGEGVEEGGVGGGLGG